MRKYNKLVFMSLIAVLIVSVTACLKDDDSEKRAKEKRLIENYVQTHNITATPTTSGLYFIPTVEGTGATPSGTDFAIIQYKGYDLDNKLFDCTDKALAEQSKITPYFAIGGPLKVYMSGFLDGVTEGLKMMKEGGKAKMIMPSILAYNDYVPRVFEVELIKVISNPMAYEREQIANFLDTATNLEVKDSTSSGIYYYEKLAGTGTVNPSSGKLVKVKYTGYLPDGRVFDKSEADTVFKFRVGGTGSSKVIDGLDNGIRLMKTGGKATMVIPYYQGYGFNALYSYGQVVIPYFSTLVFDIELVDITD